MLDQFFTNQDVMGVCRMDVEGWNPGRPLSTMLTQISIQSFLPVSPVLLVYAKCESTCFCHKKWTPSKINQNIVMGILRSLPQYFGFLPLPSSRTFVTSQLYGWQPHRLNVGDKYNSTFWCWYFIYQRSCVSFSRLMILTSGSNPLSSHIFDQSGLSRDARNQSTC